MYVSCSEVRTKTEKNIRKERQVESHNLLATEGPHVAIRESSRVVTINVSTTKVRHSVSRGTRCWASSDSIDEPQSNEAEGYA
jgi:hypothetical protein